MKNVVLTFGCKSWEGVEQVIHDALDLERSEGGSGMTIELTRVEVEN